MGMNRAAASYFEVTTQEQLERARSLTERYPEQYELDQKFPNGRRVRTGVLYYVGQGHALREWVLSGKGEAPQPV